MMYRKGFKQIALLFLVFGVVGASALASAALAEDETTILAEAPGFILGVGTHFQVTDSTYLDIEITSSEEIELYIQSAPKVITLATMPAEVDGVELTVSGLVPGQTYYKYEDDFHDATSFQADDTGTYTFTQELSQPHVVFIQEHTSTIFLNSGGGGCLPIGDWNPATLTCTLTQNVTDSIEIDGTGITLDGAGFTLQGNPTLHTGVLVRGEDITIRNLTIQGFVRGIFINGSASVTVADNDIAASHQEVGLFSSHFNVIRDNVMKNDPANTALGIESFNSNDNQFFDNEIIDVGSAIQLLTGNNRNVITTNTIIAEDVGLFFNSKSSSNIAHSNDIHVAPDKTPVFISSNSVNNSFSQSPPTGGNYWTAFDEPSEGCVDGDSDGFCDAPFVFPNGQDDFPHVGVLNATQNPIVIIPGMVASLNPEIILNDGVTGVWGFAPGVRNFYQALIDRLEEKGFEEGENLLVAHYDWRNPVADAASNYLKPAIAEIKQRTGANKVDIVAHSMGGLVARSYIQSDEYQNDVDKLITLGTPHLGAADAYVAWEGGELPDRWSPGIRLYLLGIENALRVVRSDPALRPVSLRRFFPSLKDLLSTEDHIVRDGVPISNANLTEQNTFLQTLANTIGGLDLATTATVAGTGISTLDQVALDSDRTVLDIVLQRWRDGHPNPSPPEADSIAGDQVVLTSSAHLGENNITISGAFHDQLTQVAQEDVLEILGLDPEGNAIVYDLPESIMGTVILSPVIQTVTDPDGNVFVCDSTKKQGNFECVVDEANSSGPKLLVIVDPVPGEYEVALTGTGSGEYHAVTCFADEDEDSCTTREGVTEEGEIETYRVVVTEDSFEPPTEDLAAFFCKFKPTIRSLMDTRDIEPQGFYLHGHASSLCSFAQKWLKEEGKRGRDSQHTKQWKNKTIKGYEDFLEELDLKIEEERLSDIAIQELLNIRDRIGI